MSSFGVGHRNPKLRRRDLTSRDMAMRNMNVGFQMEVLQKEKIYFTII
ncbi:MAG: hypothetical protein AAB569_03935 [Patescibacteria group bacterium]